MKIIVRPSPCGEEGLYSTSSDGGIGSPSSLRGIKRLMSKDGDSIAKYQKEHKKKMGTG